MKYRKGYKYQLADNIAFQTVLRPDSHIVTEFIELMMDGTMVISSGYAWDGPSGPTIDTDNSMTPSLYHDAAAQLMRMRLIDQKWRIPSNEEFGRMLDERGMWSFRRKLWVRELNNFGAPSTDPKNAKKILEAP